MRLEIVLELVPLVQQPRRVLLLLLRGPRQQLIRRQLLRQLVLESDNFNLLSLGDVFEFLRFRATRVQLVMELIDLLLQFECLNLGSLFLVDFCFDCESSDIEMSTLLGDCRFESANVF